MRNSKKTSGRYALDGFVPRQRTSPTNSKRPSLDNLNKKQSRRQAKTEDQILPLHSNPNKSLQFFDDEKPLKSPPEISDKKLDKTKLKKPHFWQIKKRRAYKKAKLERMSRRRKIIRRILRVILVLIVIFGLFMSWKFIKNANRIFDGNILGLFSSTKLRGEDQGRVNILLAGTSEDNPGHGGADLTDSIMLISLDTEKNTAFTVSIPRDLWVDYGAACSSGYQGKINVAYQCGNSIKFKESGYPDGGMGMLSKIVSENFGLPIHYYGKINYTAFRDAVNAVGGITVTIDSDDPRGIYDPNIAAVDGGPLLLSNGKQKLNGNRALALARARNSAGGYGLSRGDFDRTTYQRLMLIALKDKALSAGVITNPAKLGDLLDAAGKNVSTNFKTNEVRRLYEIGKDIKSSKINSIDLASDEINLLTTASFSGQSIVQPVAGIDNFSDIKQYFKKLTSNSPVVREAARVVVLNGSGVAGIAQSKADILEQGGIRVVAVANASDSYNSTIVIDKSSGAKTATEKIIESQFNVKATSQASKYADANLYDADFIIIIGTQSASVASR